MTDSESPAFSPRCVLMTVGNIGGMWTYALEMCHGLEPLGTEVILATMGEPVRREQRAQIARLAHVRLRESRFRVESMDDPWDDVARAGEWLLDLEREFEPDVVHVNSYAHGGLTWRAPVLVAAHSCLLSRWRAVHQTPAPVTLERYAHEVRHGLYAADTVVAPTQAMLDALAREYGPQPYARVIPNGADVAPLRRARKEPLVLGVGRLSDEAKNVRTLAAIADRLPWPVLLAGELAVSDRGSGDFARVRLRGELLPAELSRAYHRAAIFALPARYEPFGLTALEAARAGCALVLGDIPSLREVWGDAAIYVPPDDARAWRDSISWLIETPDELRRAAHAAQQRSMRYSRTRMIAGYLAAYHELLRRSSVTPASGLVSA